MSGILCCSGKKTVGGTLFLKAVVIPACTCSLNQNYYFFCIIGICIDLTNKKNPQINASSNCVTPANQYRLCMMISPSISIREISI